LLELLLLGVVKLCPLKLQSCVDHPEGIGDQHCHTPYTQKMVKVTLKVKLKLKIWYVKVTVKVTVKGNGKGKGNGIIAG
jgi:hypothetical protein